MSAAFDKKALFKAIGIGVNKPVTIDGFGTVFVKPLTLKEQEEFEGSLIDDQGNPREGVSVMSSLLIKVVVDEHGNHVFDKSDIPTLDASQAGPLKHVFNVAQSMNLFSSEDVERAEKN